MNSYKIIFPYQSDRIHLASNEYTAFDRCYEEIHESGKNPKIFVVLNTTSNTPYYLEINRSSQNNMNMPVEENIINKNSRDDIAKAISINSNDSIAPFEETFKSNLNENLNVNLNGENIFSNPLHQSNMRAQSSSIFSTGEINNIIERIKNYENKINAMGMRINILEDELVRTKMKVDYMSQLNIGQTNMNNLLNQQKCNGQENLEDKQKEKDEECVIM